MIIDIIEPPSGRCPVQASGTIDGEPWYFRARGCGWSVSFGPWDKEIPWYVHNAVLYVHGRYGERAQAGYMPTEHAEACLKLAFDLWIKGVRGAVEVTDGPQPDGEGES